MAALSRRTLEDLLARADIAINGDRPWDLQIDDERTFKRVLAQGSLGLGEAYMDGWWDCRRLDDFIYRVVRSGLDRQVRGDLRMLRQYLAARLLNLQSAARAFIVGEKHYDISFDVYSQMLDKRLNYSCAYWKNADTLDEAQEHKLDLICRKLSLKSGSRVLDIGCGWGSFAQYAAEKYGAEVVGITVSREQARVARERSQGLPVEFRLQDYREMNETFDHIVSVGMFEHVGYKNYAGYMDVARRCLREGGLFLLHSIGSSRAAYRGESWMDKYIFPNGMLPSIQQLGKAMENRFVMEDWHNFGADYDCTLMAWHGNFIAKRDEFAERFGERFCRMWEYYLLSCAGAFRARKIQLWQLVLSPAGVAGGYQSVR